MTTWATVAEAADRAFVADPFAGSSAQTVLRRYDAALDLLAARRPVAIVIPVFNGPQILRSCLASLTASDTRAQIVIVDDHSTDAGIEAVVAEFREQHVDCRVVRNRRNLGFVASVNVGIRAADPHRDLVLLNSDTRVTSRWLDNLTAAAHVDPTWPRRRR